MRSRSEEQGGYKVSVVLLDCASVYGLDGLGTGGIAERGVVIDGPCGDFSRKCVPKFASISLIHITKKFSIERGREFLQSEESFNAM